MNKKIIVNGETVFNPDDFAKSTDLQSAISNLNNDYYNKTLSDNRFQPVGAYLTEHLDISDLATKEELSEAEQLLNANKANKSDVYTKDETDNQINEIAESLKISYTLDFQTSTLVQDVNCYGYDIKIDKFYPFNVSSLKYSTGSILLQEMDLTNGELVIPGGQRVIWEIEKTNENEIASVGILASKI